MAEDSQYGTLIDRIVSSTSFGKSDTYGNLLRYLVDETLEGRIPKEADIAADILKKAEYEPSQNTLVRVLMFNLRKRLAAYYETEGSQDKIRITIPKGCYKVEFAQHQTHPPKKTKKRVWVYAAVFLLLLISLLANAFLINQPSEDNLQISSDDGIWSCVIKSKRPTIIILGDLFVYGEFDEVSKDTLTIRNPKLNSYGAFEFYRNQEGNRGKMLYNKNTSVLSNNSADLIRGLSELFYSNKKPFGFRFMTKFNSVEMQDNNIVAAGMLKTLGVFNDYFQHSKYKFTPPETIETRITEDSIIQFTPSGDPETFHTDYGILAKFPGPQGNTIILCGGLWDTAATECVDIITDPQRLSDLEIQMKNHFGDIPKYFEILVEVTGTRRVDVRTKVLDIHEIKADEDLWSVSR